MSGGSPPTKTLRLNRSPCSEPADTGDERAGEPRALTHIGRPGNGGATYQNRRESSRGCRGRESVCRSVAVLVQAHSKQKTGKQGLNILIGKASKVELLNKK